MAESTQARTFRCSNCGGNLTYQPGQLSMVCPYCSSQETISDIQSPLEFQELDFEAAKKEFTKLSTQEVRVVNCKACGGESTLAPNVESAECHFCGTALVVEGPTSKAMKPQYILPFMVDKVQANTAFATWIKKRWFAPNALKTSASVDSPLKGIYFPFWTFDTQTYTWYVGERGDNYTVQVQAKDSEGKTVTRTETRIRWSPASGRVQRFFDDTLVAASKSLPKTLTKNLTEWDLTKLVEPRPEFLSGFTGETYSETLEEGFEEAKDIMTPVIERDVRASIGGDHQRIHSMRTSWQDISFKYIQLPVWTLTYRFKGKFFQVLVNGQNGKISGQRPWSIIKIFLASATAAAIIAAIVFALDYFDVI